VSVSDFEAVLNHVTEEMWCDRSLAIEIVDKITEWAHGIDGLDCVDQLIPDSFFKNKHDALYVVSSLCNANNMHAADFYLFPEAVWQYPDAILWILSNLEDELSGQGFTMYPAFRGSKEEYISSLIGYIPDLLKSDKDFILELLGHTYFSDAFDLIYDWIDQSIWADREFVISVLTDVDSDAINRAAEELFKDEKFTSALEDLYDIYEWGCELLEGGKERGITLILYAAEKGNPDAISQMADMYRTGDGVEKNHSDAFKLYTLAAEKGSSDAQLYLAESYHWGNNGLEKNISEALKWYKLSAEGGNHDAMNALGFIYYRGEGVTQDYNEAFYWFKKNGFRDLPYFIYADMCFYVDKDYGNAFRLYNAALKQGVEEAAYKIGEMYFYGLGVERDYKKALEFLKYYNDEFDEDLFDEAPAKVHRMLGEIYQNGWGVKKNEEEAAKLFKAAEKGQDY
jgi:TPR repeat protein